MLEAVCGHDVSSVLSSSGVGGQGSQGSQGSRVRLLVTECWDGVRQGAAAACLDDDSIAPAPDKYNYT